jgi:hypothetical protein
MKDEDNSSPDRSKKEDNSLEDQEGDKNIRRMKL